MTLVLRILAAGLVVCGLGSVSDARASAKEDPPSERAPATRENEPREPANAAAPLTLPTVTDTVPRDYPGLHNVVAFADGFCSGSAPQGDAGFDTLKALGIKTILSVDGAEPEVEKAKSRGLRYVHLPIGYNGFDEARKAELVRAVRDLPRPLYIHCHQGKHRSAGAAGTIAVSLGWLTNDDAIARMKISGTAPSYTGLYKCTKEAGILQAAIIDAANAQFPEVARTSGLIKDMVEIDEVLEHLMLIKDSDWQAPKNHPDLVPAAEAGRLADLFRNLGQDAEVKAKAADFATRLATTAAEAKLLEDLLIAPKPDRAKLAEQVRVVNASCRDCHKVYRD